MVGDAWDPLRQWRQLLVAEVRVEEVVPRLLALGLLEQQEAASLQAPNDEQKTDMMLEMLESKDPCMMQSFLDVLAQTYPHVFLALTDGHLGGL